MLYSEFVEGTGCRQSEYNYNVYKSLEALYMSNDNLTKADIYEAGKKLVDNTPSKETQELKAQIEKEIEEAQENITYYNARINVYTSFISISQPAEVKEYKKEIKEYKKLIKANKGRINRLQLVFR